MNNIKKLFLSALLILGTTAVNAVPAKLEENDSLRWNSSGGNTRR